MFRRLNRIEYEIYFWKVTIYVHFVVFQAKESKWGEFIREEMKYFENSWGLKAFVSEHLEFLFHSIRRLWSFSTLIKKFLWVFGFWIIRGMLIAPTLWHFEGNQTHHTPNWDTQWARDDQLNLDGLMNSFLQWNLDELLSGF